MFYYNQNDYGNLTYPSKTHPQATIKSGGCGVISTLMIANNLAGKELYTPLTMRNLAIECKARENEGTNVVTLLKALCKAHSEFSFITTSNINELVSHLKKGGKAICNQGDVYNIFSTAGHFVVADRMNGNNIEVLDPQMYAGKYDSYARPARIVKKTINGCIVTPSEMKKATADRAPSYYLVSYKPKVKAPTIKPGTYTLTNVRGIYNGAGAATGRKKVSDLTADGQKNATAKSGDAYLKAGTTVSILETKLISSGNLWARIPSGWLCVWEKDKNKIFIK